MRGFRREHEKGRLRRKGRRWGRKGRRREIKEEGAKIYLASSSRQKSNWAKTPCLQAADGWSKGHFPLVQGAEGRMEACTPPSRHPLTRASNKGGRREAGLRRRASSAKGEEGAQVTAAPGNRSPGNRWQLHGLRHGLAESAGSLTCLYQSVSAFILRLPGLDRRWQGQAGLMCKKAGPRR